LQVTSQLVAIDCRAVRQDLVNYMEGDFPPALRAKIDEHLHACSQCAALYAGSSNIALLLGHQSAFQLPQGFSLRLHDRLQASLR